MADKRGVFRPEPSKDEKVAADTREVIQRSIKVLKEHKQPDTFLGRKTHEPPPREEK